MTSTATTTTPTMTTTTTTVMAVMKSSNNRRRSSQRLTRHDRELVVIVVNVGVVVVVFIFFFIDVVILPVYETDLALNRPLLTCGDLASGPKKMALMASWAWAKLSDFIFCQGQKFLFFTKSRGWSDLRKLYDWTLSYSIHFEVSLFIYLFFILGDTSFKSSTASYASAVTWKLCSDARALEVKGVNDDK